MQLGDPKDAVFVQSHFCLLWKDGAEDHAKPPTFLIAFLTQNNCGVLNLFEARRGSKGSKIKRPRGPKTPRNCQYPDENLRNPHETTVPIVLPPSHNFFLSFCSDDWNYEQKFGFSFGHIVILRCREHAQGPL